MATQLTGRRAPQLPHPQEDLRQHRASAPQRVPHRNAHLRAGRRRLGRHARSLHASTLSRDLKTTLGEDNKTDAAKKVGALIAKICLEKKIDKVVFDRNGYLYHGRVKALAEAAREAGLKF